MSKYFSSKFASLEPYVPGEQPQDMSYVKLNTNESPFDPAKEVVPVIRDAARNIRLYSDPESAALRQAIADYYGLEPENVMATNGSDEALNYAFMAFCDEEHPIVFPEITYGFYPVIATLNNIPFETISLREHYTIDSREYEGINKNICIANPNAPTGIAMALEEIEQIVRTNRVGDNRAVVIIGIYTRKGCVNDTSTAKYRVCSTPGLYSAFGNAVAFGKIGHRLKSIVNRDMLFYTVCYRILEILKIFFFYNIRNLHKRSFSN